ncbi:MAG TPA: PVC-type heme-binding CxxCH protein, partial [Pirellulales bacterium]
MPRGRIVLCLMLARLAGAGLTWPADARLALAQQAAAPATTSANSATATKPDAHDDAAAPEPPLSPEQALAAFGTDPGLRVELVAAEPLIDSPVALAFDARGRMYVVENRGYPTGPETAGRIALLEDTDADGTFDRRTEFAEGLSFPNGLMPWRDGLLVTCAPDLIYLADTDGDGHSDRREVLLTGFSTAGSTQLRASHPQLGLDNWIYVTGGLTGGKVTSPKNPDHPVVEFGRADFRFLPDCSQFEAIDGGGQFGMTFDDFGHRFICYNRVQVQHVVLPGRYLRRNKHLAARGTVQDCPADMVAEPLAGHGASARLYPISKNITTADSHAGTFTAACGVMVFRSSGLPAAYRGGVFSCDPTGNLVHFDTLQPAGATFVARRSKDESEFLASRDDWFRPVNLAQGPDGALYVCDMYRKTIEHPDYLPPEIRKHTDFESGKGMGRIWRVRRADMSEVDLFNSRMVSPNELANPFGLCSEDSWRRDTTHRLLLESRDPKRLPRLK